MSDEKKNPEVPEVSSFRKTWNILVPFLVYFVAHDLAQVFLAFVMNLSLTWFGDGYSSFMMAHAETVNGVLNGLALVIGMAFVWPMAHRELLWSKAKEKEKQEAAPDVLAYLLLAVFAVSLALGVNVLLSITGITGQSAAYENIAQRQYGVAFAAGLIIYGILSPVAEEIVFRGLIFNRMKRYFPTGISIIVCGLLFGIYHGNLVQGIYGCILGLAITFLYEKYHSFAAPVLFHSLANISVFVMGYRQDVFQKLLTPLNCIIFLIISFLSLLFILKTQNRKEK